MQNWKKHLLLHMSHCDLKYFCNLILRCEFGSLELKLKSVIDIFEYDPTAKNDKYADDSNHTHKRCSEIFTRKPTQNFKDIIEDFKESFLLFLLERKKIQIFV